MAIVFPASPSVNDTFTEGSITYKWDGAKWIGLGITPADRLVEGSNSLEINASNNLVWTGGDVGIGDTAPNGNYGTNLSVHSTATDGARLKISDGTTGKGNLDGLDIISTGGVAYFLNRESAAMSFSTGGGGSLLLTSDGDVGIGEDSPADRLVVQKTNASGDVGVRIKNDTLTDGDATNPTTASLYLNTSTGDFNTFYIQARRNDGATHFGYADPRSANHIPNLVITSGGDVGIGSTTSPRTELDLFDGQLSFSHRTDYSIRFYNGTGNNWSSISNPSTNDGTNASALSFKTAQGECLNLAKNGEVTKPKQPLAVIGTNQNNYAPAAGDNLPFNVAETDIGSNYDTSTYKFTCPVAGNYMVILTHASTRWLGDLELRRDDIVVRTLELRAIGLNNAGAADWASRSYSFIITCTVGQELHWRCSAIYTSIGSNPYLLDGQSSIGGQTVYTRYDSATYYLVG